MLKNKKGLLAAITGCLCLSLSAQNTNSPYSRYGYGILKDNSVGASRSMGGISYGLRNSKSANPGNPASYSSVDSLTFIFDIGINYSRAQLSDGTNSQYENNGGLDYITMLMPLSKKLGLSFGILPYSSVGYSFGSSENAETSSSYVKSFYGSGGISQVYGGLAYEPLKNISVGANAYYMFGSIDHTRSIPTISTSSSAYLIYDYRMLKVNTVKFDVGVQYTNQLTKNNTLTLGAVYSPKINSKARFENIYQELASSSSATSIVNADTTSMTVAAGHPATYGVGFTLTHKNNLTVGADFTYQEWEKIDYEVGNKELNNDGMTAAERFNNRWKINAGAEYMIDPMARNIFKRMKFRGGFNYGNSYLNVKNTDNVVGGYKEYGATFGIGIPVRDVYTSRVSYINIGFEYLTVRPEVTNMIKESYFGVTLNVNINDLWFMKNKFK